MLVRLSTLIGTVTGVKEDLITRIIEYYEEVGHYPSIYFPCMHVFASNQLLSFILSLSVIDFICQLPWQLIFFCVSGLKR